MMHVAYLHPPAHREGVPYTGRYDVTLDGEIIVKGSRDPEHDLARALLARGITGHVKMIDADTGRHRTTVNIEKAANLTVEESARVGPRLRTWRPYPKTAHQLCAEASPTAEDALVLPTLPDGEIAA
jgi:hypothetical protein